jgi:hypothetical protein
VPYTQQNGKCGEKGQKIHLTPDYVATLFEQQKVLQYGKPGTFNSINVNLKFEILQNDFQRKKKAKSSFTNGPIIVTAFSTSTERPEENIRSSASNQRLPPSSPTSAPTSP